MAACWCLQISHCATGFHEELLMSEVSSLPNCSFAQHPKKPATIHFSAQWVFMDAAYFLKADLQDFAELLHLGIQKLEELKGLETDDFQRDWSEGTASFSVLFVQSVLFFCLFCLFTVPVCSVRSSDYSKRSFRSDPFLRSFRIVLSFLSASFHLYVYIYIYIIGFVLVSGGRENHMFLYLFYLFSLLWV